MANDLISHANDSDFDALVIHSATPVLVDFWAIWCGPCKAIAPALEQIATEQAGKLKVVKVDVDKAQKTAMRFRVQSIPALLLFKDGKVIGQTMGAQPKAKIAEFAAKAL